MKFNIKLGFCLIFLNLISLNTVSAKELPRKILALYDSKEIPGSNEDITYTFIHRFAEMPLNHLGMELVYIKMSEPPPEVKALHDFQGILAWVEDGSNFSPQWCQGLFQALKSGKKVVIFWGANQADYVSEEAALLPLACRHLLNELGVDQKRQLSTEPIFMEVYNQLEKSVEYERKLQLRELYPFASIRKKKSVSGQVYLKLRNIMEPEDYYEPVFTTTYGGIAVQPFIFYENKHFEPHQTRWRLNPFKYFEEAFGLQNRPRPDTTTINGRRIYYSHIDGDGFFNVSELDKKKWSGEFFINEILEKYPTSPFTVSLITGYYDIRRFQTNEAMDLSRKALTLPNVEPASHGYAHPLIWSKGSVAVEIPGYQFNPEKEIVDSINWINQKILPTNEKTSLFLWTGDCLPTAAQIKVVEDQGLLNLNGGDTRFDSRYPSYSYVSPLSRTLGSIRQIYSSNTNENVYTGLWTGPFYGYREVLETFENTEKPFRIKPINVYIHFYSAEKIASLKALQEVYNWASKQPLFPIFASDYAKLANSFFKIHIQEISSKHFRIRESNELKTIRFDREKRWPDLDLSKGLIGFRHHQENLYVFLDEGQEHEIILTQKQSKKIYVQEANFHIFDWQANDTGASFLKKGWWKGEMVLGGLKPHSVYQIESEAYQTKLKAGLKGSLAISFPDSEGKGNPRLVQVRQMP